MKVYFLNPPRQFKKLTPDLFIGFNVSRFSRGVDIVYAVTPPTELSILAAAVDLVHDVKIIDANAMSMLPGDVFRILLKEHPDYLVVKAGDSMLLEDLSYYYYAESLGIRSILWEDILNPEYSTEFQKRLNVKRILWGEPERNIFRFLEGEEGVIGGDTIEDLDGLPIPLMEKLPMELYRKDGKNNWYMFLHRGCGWGRCKFCLIEGKKARLRKRSANHIRVELDKLKKFGVETIYFWDPQINPSRERVMEICDILSGYPFRWECWMRTDVIDEEMASAMKQSGCIRVHFGVESGEQRVLDSICKGTTPERIERAFSICRRCGIETVAYCCIGTPEEDPASLRATIRLLKRIRPTTIVPASFRPFPGTGLTTQLEEMGIPFRDHFSLSLEGNGFGRTNTCDSKYLKSHEIERYIDRIRSLSTRVGLRSYVQKPRMWKPLSKAFLLRTLHQQVK